MDDSSYIDTTSSTSDRDKIYYWTLLKHQIRMSSSFLKSQYCRGENYLISINALVSSLSTLVSGKDTEERVDLAQMLMDSKCSGRSDANDIISYYCRGNGKNLEKNARSLSVTNFYYSHPSKPISSLLKTKLKMKYGANAKELNFMLDKPNLQALATINADARPATISSMISGAEFTKMVNSSVFTILSSAVHFDGLWSKSFEVEHRQFQRSDGSLLKMPFLVRSKSYLYYHDGLTKAQIVQINASPDSNLALMLLLPDKGVSVEQYIHSMLSYESLKRIFKKVRTRTIVQLAFPKFRLTASRHIAKPTQALALKRHFELSQGKYGKQVDDNVLLLQKVTIDVQERGVDKSTVKPINWFLHDQVNFNADRPFIFALVTRGKAQQIVMLGVCNDPSKAI